MPEGRYRVSSPIKGRILGTRRIQDRGRVQIPKEVRDALKVEDGESVYWIQGPEGRFYILKAAMIEGRIEE